MATVTRARPPYSKRDVLEEYDRGWWQTELGNIQRAILPSSVKSVAGAYTPTAQDRTVLCDTTAGAMNVRLEAANRLLGLELIIKKTAGAAPVTIQGTIDGVLNPVLANVYDSITIVSDGTQWLKIASTP